MSQKMCEEVLQMSPPYRLFQEKIMPTWKDVLRITELYMRIMQSIVCFSKSIATRDLIVCHVQHERLYEMTCKGRKMKLYYGDVADALHNNIAIFNEDGTRVSIFCHWEQCAMREQIEEFVRGEAFIERIIIDANGGLGLKMDMHVQERLRGENGMEVYKNLLKHVIETEARKKSVIMEGDRLPCVKCKKQKLIDEFGKRQLIYFAVGTARCRECASLF